MMNIKFIYIILAIIFFIFLPILFFIFSHLPQRTILKNTISIITIMAFFIVLGEFFLSRINLSIKEVFKIAKVIKIHKIIGYIILPILLVHPFLVVVPRFFEVGAKPFESFIKMITTFDSLGIVLGIIAWVLMLLLGITSIFRNKLNISYKNWKTFHGILALTFIVFASWHAINLGRHMDIAMILLIVGITLFASFLLLKSYFFSSKKNLKIQEDL